MTHAAWPLGLQKGLEMNFQPVSAPLFNANSICMVLGGAELACCRSLNRFRSFSPSSLAWTVTSALLIEHDGH